MSCMETICARRSIRKFREQPVPRALTEEVIRAGTLAPSAKNRQPWQFVVAEEDAKKAAVRAMQDGLARERNEPFLPGSARHFADAENTLRIMRSCPVLIFAVNPLAPGFERPLSAEERVSDLCNAQSLGAALENMSLAACELGLGSLWICNTFFAQSELQSWLKTDGELLAALALGYADESPAARPRTEFSSVVEWRK